MVCVVIRFQPVLSLYSYPLCHAAAWCSAIKLTYYAQYYVQKYKWFLVYIIEGYMKTMNKSLHVENNSTETFLLECIYMWYQNYLYYYTMIVLLEYIDCMLLFSIDGCLLLYISYSAGVMLNALSDPLCSKL